MGPWDWTFNSSVQSDSRVTFSVVLVKHGNALVPEVGTAITVTGGNDGAQCTTPPSFTATIVPGRLIRGSAVSCQGTFAFNGMLANGRFITGRFTSNGWGSPGGTLQATPQSNSGETTFTTATTFVGPITSTGSNLFTGPNTFSSPGTFGNSQSNDFVQSLLNSCDPGTEFRQQQDSQNDTAAYTGCVTVPVSSNVHQASAVAGFVDNASTATNAVGGYFQAVNNVSNGYIWGINPLIASVPGKPAARCRTSLM